MRLRLLVFALSVACAGVPAVANQADEPVLEENILPNSGEGHLSGLVVDTANGKPVSLAAVSVLKQSATEPVAETYTDVSGRYRLLNIVPGTYRVLVQHGTLVSDLPAIVILADKTTELRHSVSSHRAADGTDREKDRAIESRSGNLTGRVLDGPRGEPFAGVVVDLIGDELREPLLTISADDSRFEFTGLAPGTYNVAAYYSLIDKGHVEIRRIVVVKSGINTELILELDTEVR